MKKNCLICGKEFETLPHGEAENIVLNVLHLIKREIIREGHLLLQIFVMLLKKH